MSTTAHNSLPRDPAPVRSLVTGGAGFIGSHLVAALLARGDHVTVVDDLSTGRRINLPPHHARLTLRVESLDRACSWIAGERFDEVYHLAAAVGVKLIVTQPIRSIETNITQTAALLAALCAQPSPPRLLIASSSEVYGKSARVPFHEDDDVTYGPTTVSRWSYAMSKAIDEHLALAYATQHSLPVVIARFFNTVGPGQVGEYGMVLPRFIESALSGEPLVVHGDGTQTRCFCDVRDVSGVLPRLLACGPALSRVVNIGSDSSISVAQLAQQVIAVTGSKSVLSFVPHAQVYGKGFEDLAHRRPDVSRLRELVGFAPAHNLEKTIRDTAAWISGGRGSGADFSKQDAAWPAGVPLGGVLLPKSQSPTFA
jgi:UDP-glucose 4-epimerase